MAQSLINKIALHKPIDVDIAALLRVATLKKYKINLELKN